MYSREDYIDPEAMAERERIAKASSVEAAPGIAGPASALGLGRGSPASPPYLMPKGKTLDEKAFANGWNAFLRGSPKWSNPYLGDGLRFMWEAGWLDSKAASKARRRHAKQENA